MSMRSTNAPSASVAARALRAISPLTSGTVKVAVTASAARRSASSSMARRSASPRARSSSRMVARSSTSRIVDSASSLTTMTSRSDHSRGSKSMAQNEPITWPPAVFSGMPRYAATPMDSTVGTCRYSGSARVSGMTSGRSETMA